MSGKMYQVQNGQKVDITPQVVSLSSGTKRNVGEIVYSMVPLEDAGMHLLDGSLLSTTGVYAEGVAAIIALRPNHPYLFTSETMWQQSVNQYDVCGKFVYDAGAGTLRLPKVTGFIEGTVDPTAIGQLVEAGLPNIVGFLSNVVTEGPAGASGALQFNDVTRTVHTPTVSGAGSSGIKLDASGSSPIYGNSTTVQPQAIKGFVYMVMANSLKTPVQVDINNVAADLALKADVSLGNVNSSGAAAMAHAALPSGQYIDLTLPAHQGTVTAPEDGWLYFAKMSTGGGQSVALSVYNADQTAIVLAATDALSSSNATGNVFVPVTKGAVVQVYYSAAGALAAFRFTYANGSAPTN